ncbi:hypothetical protein [Roseobacter sp.]|uniref:hypothetical protein n=1 Tax=Roseobacter sp. TaxID=1907202 RepID=UPI003858145D
MALIQLTGTILLLIAAPVTAQHSHDSPGGGDLLQTGQAQFAAISEIVEILRNDPATEWENVNLRALRDHLVDMDNVTARSTVVTKADGNIVTFTIIGENEVVPSIQSMVTSHSPMLAAETGWSVASTSISDGATMAIEVPDHTDLNQVLGLGFYGVLTIGAHHKKHHLMIATGNSPH